jgi:hypothetical protein
MDISVRRCENTGFCSLKCRDEYPNWSEKAGNRLDNAWWVWYNWFCAPEKTAATRTLTTEEWRESPQRNKKEVSSFKRGKWCSSEHPKANVGAYVIGFDIFVWRV